MQTVGLTSGPHSCADSSLSHGWNTTRRRLGLGPDQIESYPLLVDPEPTVAGDLRDVEGVSSDVFSGVLYHKNETFTVVIVYFEYPIFRRCCKVTKDGANFDLHPFVNSTLILNQSK